jgi:Zn-dependent protease with chaperone function
MVEFLLTLPILQCAQVAVPEASEQAMNYYRSGNVLWLVQQLWSLIIPLLFLYKGFTGKLARLSEQVGKNWYFTIVVYLLFFIFLSTLLNLPFDFYADYVREHAYHLSTETLSRWIGQYALSMVVSMVGAAAFVWVFYWLLKKSPRRWWFYGSLASTVILFIVMFIQPIWVDPLFYNFGAMKNKELEQQILGLASRAGIEKGRVFEVDMSQETTKLNAYVVGFGATNRIVLWDTTIARMKPDEILFVMGHEMGHYILHHMWWDLIYMTFLSFLIFYLTYKSATYLLRRFNHKWGFNRLDSIASLPLLLFLVTFFMLLATPLTNYFTRHLEHEADRFGLEITQNNQAAGDGFIVLQLQNLSNPRPGNLYKFWRSTHPPLGERVDFSNSYCPWKEGKPLKYGKYFKNE